MLQESHVSIQRGAGAAKAGVGQAAADQTCITRTDGWIQLGEGELNLQHRRSNFVERNATWQMMQVSCPHPHALLPTTNHLINTSSTPATTTPLTNSTNVSTITPSTSRKATSKMDQRLINTSSSHDLSIFITPHCMRSSHENGLSNNNGYNYNHLNSLYEDYSTYNCSTEESQTLQLFPLRSEKEITHGHQINSVSDINATAGIMTTPCQFFEFLPLKN